MTTNEETTLEWCTRMWKHIDGEFGPICRWTIRGWRNSTREPGIRLGRVCRFDEANKTGVRSPEALYDALEREIKNAGYRLVSVDAWARGARKRAGSKVWPRPDFAELFDEDDCDEEEFENEAPRRGRSHPDSNMGINRDLVRMTERTYARSTAAHESTIRWLGVCLQREREENAELRKEVLKNRELHESVLDRTQARDLKTQRQKLLTETAGAAINILQYKLIGDKLTPSQKDSVLESAIKQFAGTLTEDQLNMFRPDQQFMMAQLLDEVGSDPEQQTGGSEPTRALQAAPSPAPPAEQATDSGSAVSADVLRVLREQLPPEGYTEALALLREASALLRDPLGALLEPKACDTAYPKDDPDDDAA